MSLFRNTPKDPESLLDQTLYTVPGTGTKITWADAVEGTLILGSTGSGKSSGPGRHAALAMLKQGFGFCILSAKADGRARWEGYAKETGRSNDLVIFNKANDLKFNFLQYEMTRSGEGAGELLNIVNALMNLNEQNRVYQSGSGGKDDEKFWDNSLRRMISRTVNLLKLTGEEVSIHNMNEIVTGRFEKDDMQLYTHLKDTITTTEKIDHHIRRDARQKMDTWVKNSYFLRTIEKLQKTDLQNDHALNDALLVLNYWIRDFPKVGEKTTSIIVESFLAIIEPFLNDGILKRQFSQGLDEQLLPENIINKRKIVIIDYPVKEYGLAGIYASIIYKTVFMTAMERRKITDETDPRPVALWIDEYQSFCNPMADTQFQATARSSWVATVYITQNINNIYFVMGNNMAEARAKSLLGNLNLKYFASNADFDTNQWASNMIGQHYVHKDDLRISDDLKYSKSKSHELRPRIRPDFFTTLKTGRKANGYIVDAVVFKPGKTWGNEGHNLAVVEFKQC